MSQLSSYGHQALSVRCIELSVRRLLQFYPQVMGPGAVQVPPPSQRVLPWEVELEDGSIVSTIKEDSSGEGILSLTLGTLGQLVLRAVTGIAKKMHLL